MVREERREELWGKGRKRRGSKNGKRRGERIDRRGVGKEKTTLTQWPARP